MHNDSYSSVLYFFWKHVKPFRRYYFLMLFATVFSCFYSLIYSYFLKIFLDVINNESFVKLDLFFPIVILAAVSFFNYIVWALSSWASSRSVPYVRRSITLEVYDRVQNHPYRYFQEHFTGAIIAKIKGIQVGYDILWNEIHYGIWLNFITVLVTTNALMFVNKSLYFFMIFWEMVYFFVISRMLLKTRDLAYFEKEAYFSNMEEVSDRITNILTLLSFSTREREYKTLDLNILKNFIPKQINAFKYEIKFQIVDGLAHVIMILFTILYSIYLKINGFISLGDFALIFSLILTIGEALWQFIYKVHDFAKEMGALKISFGVLHSDYEQIDEKKAKPYVIKKGEIFFDNISFSYHPGVSLFKNFSLKISPGEKVGIVGYSGSGKSTLISLLLKYFLVQEGRILVDGIDLRDITHRSLRRQIALISQEIYLFHRTLFENISYGCDSVDLDRVVKASKRAYIHESIMKLPKQYYSHIGERGSKFSLGQRQRVAIARAILKESPILILDEATSSLDNITEKQIQKTFNSILEDSNKTLLVIAHRLSHMKKMDRIIVLKDGKILEEGTHRFLLEKGSHYKLLWNSHLS